MRHMVGNNIIRVMTAMHLNVLAANTSEKSVLLCSACSFLRPMSIFDLLPEIDIVCTSIRSDDLYLLGYKGSDVNKCSRNKVCILPIFC